MQIKTFAACYLLTKIAKPDLRLLVGIADRRRMVLWRALVRSVSGKYKPPIKHQDTHPRKKQGFRLNKDLTNRHASPTFVDGGRGWTKVRYPQTIAVV
jgi:hypothetical protein